jgi:transposase
LIAAPHCAAQPGLIMRRIPLIWTEVCAWKETAKWTSTWTSQAEGYAGRLEVIEGPTGRRRRTDAEKARIVAESLMPGVRLADVARRHGATRWQIYDWRKRLRNGHLAVPESMASTAAFAALVVEEPSQPRQASVGIDIILGDIVIRAGQDADDRHLSRVIRAVRASA